MKTPCDECALRLFNDECHCLEGIGNPWSGRMIVIPNVDYKAYKNKDMTFSKYVEIIKSILITSTGGLECYIVPLIRCKLNNACPVDNLLMRRCASYLFKDIEKYNINKILLLGRASELLIDGNIYYHTNRIYIGNSTMNKAYSVDYSPLIKDIDDNKYKEFCNRLVKWYNADKYNDYEGFKIIKL